ncbi:alpha/beta hydrolase [Paenarthrobacter nitroguajacolicus]|uniref:alpha/beta fold hydrolase n=1 Tax=Paenarthrobacter nitroguajacolicus TaxID=211146 RepID=UPI00285C4103|nr:alpha/beta hydrolase [Paenarthrobacter nitroguajacolicus]MDR6637155.1 pimeloyl-ACP methyl ester carboxylesterase [Paenarthrobacter nitroguajacolicus]
MNFAEAADGTSLAWTSEGDGEPMLLIAGQATAMDGWGPTAELLSRFYRIIRFDHRGIGQSGRGDAGRYTTRLLAQDAAAVLAAADAGAAHVYGHSMGGRIGQWLAIDHPEQIRTLVLAATSGGKWPDAETQPGKAALEALVSGDVARLEPLFFDADWAQRNPDATHAFFNSPASAWAKARHFRASREHDAWSELSNITSPTLILHGTDDRLTPLPNARLLRRHIPRSVLVRVPGAGHGLHLDHPETVDWIRQFIARTT